MDMKSQLEVNFAGLEEAMTFGIEIIAGEYQAELTTTGSSTTTYFIALGWRRHDPSSIWLPT